MEERDDAAPSLAVGGPERHYSAALGVTGDKGGTSEPHPAPAENGWDDEGGDIFFGEKLEASSTYDILRPVEAEGETGGLLDADQPTTSGDMKGDRNHEHSTHDTKVGLSLPADVSVDLPTRSAEKLDADTSQVQQSTPMNTSNTQLKLNIEPAAMEGLPTRSEPATQRKKSLTDPAQASTKGITNSAQPTTQQPGSSRETEQPQRERHDAEREALEMEREAQRLLEQVQRLQEAAQAKRMQQLNQQGESKGQQTKIGQSMQQPPTPASSTALPQQQDEKQQMGLMREKKLQNKQEVQRLRIEADRLKDAEKLQHVRHQEENALSRMERLEREWEKQPTQSPLLNRQPDTDTDLEYSPERSPRMRRKGGGMTQRRQPRVDSTEESAADHQSDDDDIEKQKSPKSISKGGAGGGLSSVMVVLRKIAHTILTNPDDDTLRLQETEPAIIIITLLKEAMLGTVIAFFLILLFMFIDQRLILGLPLSRNARMAASYVMELEEGNLDKLEEEAGVKFINVDEYESIKKEIEEAPKKIKFHEDDLKEKAKNFVNTQAEHAVVEAEYPKLFNKLKLDQFCEECIWSASQKVTCNMRAEALEDTYNTPKFEAILAAMEKKTCWKSAEQIELDKENRMKEDILMKNWAEVGSDFCSDCSWQGDKTCHVRAGWLTYRYGLGFDRARARIMSESDKCKKSFFEEQKKILDEKLAQFVEDGQWGNHLTCKQRVEFLRYTYKTPEHEAILDAMKKPVCVKNAA